MPFRILCEFQTVVGGHEAQSCYSNTIGFQTAICFTGRSLDPLLVAATLYYNVLDFHIIGTEPIRKAVERSACCSLLFNTSLIILNSDDSFSLCNASIRFRPNGELICCSACAQPSEYYKQAHGTVIFRCRNDAHPKTINRCQDVRLLQSDEARVVVGSSRAPCRYIVTK
jgi:hypothetical protein